jgi:hypothetical protein
MPMTETDEYILEVIRKCIWSGFYTPDEVDIVIDDILEEDADEEMLRAAVASEIARKSEAEKSWPDITDCDRLDSLCEILENRGILFLQNAGYTISEGHQEAFELLSSLPEHNFIGYCFYHAQDVDQALDNNKLYLAFEHVDGDIPETLKVGQILREELVRAGYTVNWNGEPNCRISINIDWKRRYHG